MNLNLFDDMNGAFLHERESLLEVSSPENVKAPSVSKFPKSTPLAMAYVPYQQWNDVYDDDAALKKGTLFPDLDFPFCPGGNSYE